jgi:NADPH:quinone reductase
MLLKGASVVGVFWGDYIKREPKASQAAMRQMMGWMAEGKLRPRISARYPLERTAEALIALAERRATGKVVILP